LQRIRALPGVTAAGTVDTLPFAAGSGQPLLLEGYPPQRRTVPVRQVTPGYLRAMGIPVLRGRDIVESDAEVLLVSQEAAKLYWGNDDPIGRRAILPALSRTVLRQVVGIVGDVKQRNLIEGSTPTVYLYTREPNPGVTFAIRTTVPPAMLAQPAVAAIRAIDPEQPVQDIRTMGQVLDGQLIPQRFSALLAKLVDIHLFQQSIRAEREHQYVRLGSYSATPPFCHTGASAVRATAIRKAFHRWCVTIATDAGGR
jgi:putative ABC transport system permease protein